MNLDFNFEENDFYKAIGITDKDKEAFIMFKRMYYLELQDKLKSEQAEKKLNEFQTKRRALELSSHSRMLKTGIDWFKDSKRKDQMIVLLLGDIFFKIITSDSTIQQFNRMKIRKGKTIH